MATAFIALAETSAAVASTSSRNAKRDALAALLNQLHHGELATAVCFLSGQLPSGRIGVGPAAVRKAAKTPPAPTPHLTLAEVQAAFDDIKRERGAGSAGRRDEHMRRLFAACSESEQTFVMQLLVGELRQGALGAAMLEAIAKATSSHATLVRRAYMLSGDLAAVAQAAATAGNDGLSRFRLVIGQPVESMLAQPAEDIGVALAGFGDSATAVLDYKLDGARVQVHKDGTEVAVFSRQLNDVTAAVPEVVAAVRELPVERLVLDGEAIALDGNAPLPFQVTMRRFGRRQDVAALAARLPLSVRFFDCLHSEGQDLIDATLAARLARLDALVPADLRMPRTVTNDPAVAADFLQRALGAGHEGVMVKDPTSSYQAGRRGAAWLKIKQVHSLDLVVLAAEWGSGRRRGTLSNLHLGARLANVDGAGGDEFVMLGKTFKGLSDETLAWQTRELLARETHRDRHTVYVEPQLVVEISFNDVQASSQYPGGMALRFARVVRYRPDKSAADAATLDQVAEIAGTALGRAP